MRSPLLAILLLALAVPASAADEAFADAVVRADAKVRADKSPSAAQVVVFNRPIVRFRAPLFGIPPAERAVNTAERIRALLRAPGPHTVSVEEIEQGAVVKIDGQLAVGITHADAEHLGAVAETALADDAARKLQVVIAEMREARDPRALLTAAGYAAAATAVWLAALWLLRLTMRVLRQRMFRYAEVKSAEMRAAGHEIVQREHVLDAIRTIVRAVFGAVALLLSYEWLGFVLRQFPYTRPWGEGFATFLVDTFFEMLAGVAGSAPGLVIVVAIVVIAHFANGLLRSFFDGVQTGRLNVTWLDQDTVRPTRRLVGIAVWLFAIAMAYPYIPGADTDAFKGVSVLLGLMVSVGASGIVGQAASGLILMYTRTYRPGEYVKIVEHEGTVVYLGMFTTRVRTGMGEELTLPNSMILGTATKNYSRAIPGTGFIADATVTIGYDTPWRQVHAMLAEAARRTPGVLAQPAPHVFQTALSDFYVEYRLACYAGPHDPHPRAVIISTLNQSIQDVFNEYGVQIMSPHYLGDPPEAKVVPPAKWYPAPAKPPTAPPA